MKKIIKIMSFALVVTAVIFSFIGCGKNENRKNETCNTAEKITLASAVLGEVEFTNADTVKLEQDCDEVDITGTVSKMSASQKTAYGLESVDHVVVVKMMFDKERTLSSFELKGDIVKVFSTDNTVENYAGSISDLLDSESGEDAYCYLILSAERKDYTLTSKYSDGTKSVISVEVSATLANADAE